MATYDAMFELIPHPSRRMLRVNLHGYWTPEVMPRYQAAVRSEMDAGKAAGGFAAFLIDTTNFPIQSQEVAAQHEEFLAAAGKSGQGRVAVLIPRDHPKLQVKRVASNVGLRTFDSEQAALTWLFPEGDS